MKDYIEAHKYCTVNKKQLKSDTSMRLLLLFRNILSERNRNVA